MIKRNRNTKIVATLGPASSDEKVIENLFLSGADVFRLNFSHGTHQDHAKTYQAIRAIEEKHNHPIAVMVDLQGPKLRVGLFSQGRVRLEQGQSFTFDLNESDGDESRVNLPHPEIFKALSHGDHILVDDGKINLKVTSVNTDIIVTEVIVGGTISDHKGVNVPTAELPVSALTEKDRKDLDFGLSLGADFIALSFVQKPDDIVEAVDLIKGRAKIVAKLEKPQAINHLDAIVELSDGVLVARGDLGVEMPPEDVPSIQKQIIRSGRQHGKPVIVATQMLDSMVSSPVPTRAEASDVANAVYDGADGVMLSAESASGVYPQESVAMMDRIIRRVEQDPHYRKGLFTQSLDPDATTSDAITKAASSVVDTLKAKAIVTFTASGSTTLRAVRERPAAPILALTSEEKTARQLSMSWGVHAVISPKILDFFEMALETSRVTLAYGFAKAGESVVITAGVPYRVSQQSQVFVPGTTNILRIIQVEES